MVYKFNIKCKKEDSNFIRVIEIAEDDTFFSFYNTIHQCANYDNSQMTSFFVSNDEWERFEEITLMDMGVKSDNIFIMSETKLNKFVKKQGDKLVYLFDFFSERFFKIELVEIIDKSLPIGKANCVYEKGSSPKQIVIDSVIDDTEFNLTEFDDFDEPDDDIQLENIDDIDDI